MNLLRVDPFFVTAMWGAIILVLIAIVVIGILTVLGGKVSQVKVREVAGGRVIEIPTAMAMTDLVMKGSVPTPKAYAIDAAVDPTERYAVTVVGAPS